MLRLGPCAECARSKKNIQQQQKNCPKKAFSSFVFKLLPQNQPKEKKTKYKLKNRVFGFQFSKAVCFFAENSDANQPSADYIYFFFVEFSELFFLSQFTIYFRLTTDLFVYLHLLVVLIVFFFTVLQVHLFHQ